MDVDAAAEHTITQLQADQASLRAALEAQIVQQKTLEEFVCNREDESQRMNTLLASMWTELEAAKQAMQSTFHMQAELDRAREEAELNRARLVTYSRKSQGWRLVRFPHLKVKIRLMEHGRLTTNVPFKGQ
jgi:hypothetical protein